MPSGSLSKARKMNWPQRYHRLPAQPAILVPANAAPNWSASATAATVCSRSTGTPGVGVSTSVPMTNPRTRTAKPMRWVGSPSFSAPPNVLANCHRAVASDAGSGGRHWAGYVLTIAQGKQLDQLVDARRKDLFGVMPGGQALAQGVNPLEALATGDRCSAGPTRPCGDLAHYQTDRKEEERGGDVGAPRHAQR